MSRAADTYYVEANANGDIHISNLQIILVDSAIDLDKFGKLSQLTNGVDIKLIDGADTIWIAEKVQTMGEFHLWNAAHNAFGGDKTDIGKLDKVNPNYLGIVWSFPVGEWWGANFRIGRGTSTQLQVVTNDSLAGMDGAMYARIMGYVMLAEGYTGAANPATGIGSLKG